MRGACANREQCLPNVVAILVAVFAIWLRLLESVGVPCRDRVIADRVRRYSLAVLVDSLRLVRPPQPPCATDRCAGPGGERSPQNPKWLPEST